MNCFELKIAVYFQKQLNLISNELDRRNEDGSIEDNRRRGFSHRKKNDTPDVKRGAVSPASETVRKGDLEHNAGEPQAPSEKREGIGEVTDSQAICDC